LTGLGHRRVAYISGPELLTTTKVRLAGYRATIKKHHLDDRPELVLSGDYSFQSGQRAAETIANMKDRPTAVLASSDLMGIGCLTGLREQGYRIPADISVMGIDDIAFARFVDPPLTTMTIPMYELGKTGFEMLLNLRQGEASPDDEIILPHGLVERKSTAKVKAAPQTVQ